jgi:hypothetical protein
MSGFSTMRPPARRHPEPKVPRTHIGRTAPNRVCHTHNNAPLPPAQVAPAATRVQRAVDRRFNRVRYDADLTLAAFAARLKDEVDLDAIRTDLAGVVQHALEPTHVSLWIRDAGEAGPSALVGCAP